MTTDMTYEVAKAYIKRLQEEMPEYDVDPKWSVIILNEPVAEFLPGEATPPDMQKPEWQVHVAWYCAAPNDLSTGPSEYGTVTILSNDLRTTHEVYVMLEHNQFRWLRRRMKTYRTLEDAVADNS